MGKSTERVHFISKWKANGRDQQNGQSPGKTESENQATNSFSLTTELSFPKYGVEEKKRDPRNQDSVQSQRWKDSSALSYWSFFKPSHSG